MIIYTTLKANREHEVDFVEYCDECFTQVGSILGAEYLDEYNYTDWEKVYKDFTDRQIKSKVLTFLKNDAKDKEGLLFKYGGILIDREFVYMDCLECVRKGIFKASDLREIERQSKKFNFSIKTEEYGEDGYYHTYYVEDIIEQFFPCNFKTNEECINCGNCD